MQSVKAGKRNASKKSRCHPINPVIVNHTTRPNPKDETSKALGLGRPFLACLVHRWSSWGEGLGGSNVSVIL